MFKLQNIEHRFGKQPVLDLQDFSAEQGEHWLILGRSGSGKTTLLNIIAGILTPRKGTVIVAGQNLRDFRSAALDQFRGQHIGIVFQQLHLLKTLNVEQNLILAQYMAGIEPDRSRARQVLETLNLRGRARAYPEQLSQGERQRVCIGRAVMNDPRVLLADEPTSSLDDEHADDVLSMIEQQAEKHNATLVIATHDKRVKDRFQHRIDLSSSEEAT